MGQSSGVAGIAGLMYRPGDEPSLADFGLIIAVAVSLAIFLNRRNPSDEPVA